MTEEKPDDVVERCAQAQAYPQYYTDWNCLRDGQKNFLRNHARAVLDAAGFERLREKASYLDAVAAALHPHWRGDGHTYIPTQLPGMIERLRENREFYRADSQKLQDACAEESRRAEAAETALAEARRERDEWKAKAERATRRHERCVEVSDKVHERIADLEKVAEAARLMRGAEVALSNALYALDAAYEDSGEPAATVAADSSGSAPQAEKTVTAGSSSLSDDDPSLDATDGAHPAWWRGHDRAEQEFRRRERGDDIRTVAIMTHMYRLDWEAAKRRKEPLDAMFNPAESEPSIIRSGFELLERVRLVKKTL